MRTGRRDQQGEAMPAPYYSFARRAWVAYVGLWQGDFFTGAEGVEAFADYQHALQASRFLARRAGRTKLLAVPCLEERTDECPLSPADGKRLRVSSPSVEGVHARRGYDAAELAQRAENRERPRALTEGRVVARQWRSLVRVSEEVGHEA